MPDEPGEPGSEEGYDEDEAQAEDEDSSYLAGIHVGIVDLIGTIDIAAQQRQMNTLKQVPLSVARELLRGGQKAIDQARFVAEDMNLPGGTARDNVYWKLKWHEDSIAKLAGKPPETLYLPGQDLKKWVVQAYIEANAAEEGAGWIAEYWKAMWVEIAKAIAALPKQIIQKVIEEGERFAAGAESVSKWLIGGAVLLGIGLLYGAYRLLSGPAGQTVSGHYLPGR